MLLACCSALREAGALNASFTLADVDEPGADKVWQSNASGLMDATVSLWLESVDAHREIEAILTPLANRLAGYLVTESVPRRMHGPLLGLGERTPGVALISTFPKPAALDDDTFYARWYGSHTPLSLEIHPLVQYIRNSVARPLTPGAPPLRAIVNESVASAAIVADPLAFFGSKDGQKRAVDDLLSFVDMETLSSILMNEYTLIPLKEE